LQGDLLRPDHPDYESARPVWNGMIDKHPALIVRCQSIADVVAAVNVAREHQLVLAVRELNDGRLRLQLLEGGRLAAARRLGLLPPPAPARRARRGPLVSAGLPELRYARGRVPGGAIQLDSARHMQKMNGMMGWGWLK
jgi:hypothetical protein